MNTQMSKLESVFQSDEAKNLLDEAGSIWNTLLGGFILLMTTHNNSGSL